MVHRPGAKSGAEGIEAVEDIGKAVEMFYANPLL
jgi:hypothetical protein